jgi:hypothetical protein
MRPGSRLPRPGAFLDASWSDSGQENRRKQAQYSIFNARRKKVGPNRRDMHQLALSPPAPLPESEEGQVGGQNSVEKKHDAHSSKLMAPALIAPTPPPVAGAMAENDVAKSLCINNLYHQSTNSTTREKRGGGAIRATVSRHFRSGRLAQCSAGCGRRDHFSTSACSTAIALANCSSFPWDISSGDGQIT